jgi:methylmalonyl-CoA mutase N-terminal domain/subunit
MRDTYGAKDPRSEQLRIFVFTAGSSLTAQQPLNNVVRTSIEAMAAALGGVQTMHVCAYDEALGVPTETAATLRTRCASSFLARMASAGRSSHR